MLSIDSFEKQDVVYKPGIRTQFTRPLWAGRRFLVAKGVCRSHPKTVKYIEWSNNMNILEKLNKINSKVAIIITNVVGTMWCAYAFALLTLLSLPQAINGGIATLISWIAQTFLQLVLLSIIMVGQSVQSEKSETRAEQDHETLMLEFGLLTTMQSELLDEISALKEISQKLT